jgi:nicotinate-nucleotide adenylyltransferase
MRKRIVLLGGTFDPIHDGHVKIARRVISLRQADEFWFVVNLQSPLKTEKPSSFEHRARMIELMIAPYRKFKVSRVEASLNVPSYTIDTVNALMRQYPAYDFEWLIGSDQAESFHLWKDHERLRAILPILVYPRLEVTSRVQGLMYLDFVVRYKASSQAIRQGELQWTHPKVIAYATQHGLYLNAWVQAKMSKKRYEHTLSVTTLALELAHIHRVDPLATRQAAMLHDIAKEWPIERLRTWLMVSYPRYLEQPTELWHQKVGAMVVKRIYMVRNQAVFHAIAHHVEGDHPSDLARILYIADKCEPTRAIDAAEVVRLAKKDLKLAVKLIQIEQSKHLKEKAHRG